MPYGHHSLLEVWARSLALRVEAQMRATFKQVPQPRKRAAFSQKRTQHIPTAVKGEVALRDHFQSTLWKNMVADVGTNEAWSITLSRPLPRAANIYPRILPCSPANIIGGMQQF